MSKLISVFLLVILSPGYAYAYLDPASGNAILSTLIAVFGSLLYMGKTLFYRVFSSKSKTPEDVLIASSKQQLPVIFSEGKSYWGTFKPIIEELINRKQSFRYITLDMHDPGLRIDDQHMHSKLYTPNRINYWKLSKINTPVMLATTPNIGCEKFPLKKSAGVKELVHIFHAFANISDYRLGSLDFYDTVLMIGDHEIEPIRKVETARGIKTKKLKVGGLPYIDELHSQVVNEGTRHNENSRPTVLIAPSWGVKGCLNEYGTEFIKKIAESGFNVIVRLHPHSYINEPDRVKEWRSDLHNITNISWDQQRSGKESMEAAEILISDTSSVRFDFAFIFMKPVITLEIPKDKINDFEGIYLNDNFTDQISGEIGITLNHRSINSIVDSIDAVLGSFSAERLENLRADVLPLFGNSAQAISDYLIRNSNNLLSNSDK